MTSVIGSCVLDGRSCFRNSFLPPASHNLLKASANYEAILSKKHVSQQPNIHISCLKLAATCRATTPDASATVALTIDSSRSATAAASSTSRPSLRVCFRTNWDQAWLHGSLGGQAWTDFPMTKVPSSGGRYMAVDIDLSNTYHNEEAPLLEFVVTDKKGNWDKPPTGGNFRIQTAGQYKLRYGAITPLSGHNVMVVSDLDGTMVGDDTATAAFKSFWEDTGALRGGVLVYNTGRALESFTNLMKEKGHCLAQPDALISAVGTKIYEFDGRSWQEDKKWSAMLDEHWKADVVRDACYKARAKVGSDAMHFRPPEEQNEHKITCGVNVRVLETVLQDVKDVIASAGLQANVIYSGAGDWRYLDVVPIRAGKLEALNYVRQLYGFSVHSTVACGDSGNDILMLSGENPAIVVGNAQTDLKKWVSERQQQEAGKLLPDGKTRLKVVQKHEAFGILEGLEYFGFK